MYRTHLLTLAGILITGIGGIFMTRTERHKKLSRFVVFLGLVLLAAAAASSDKSLGFIEDKAAVCTWCAKHTPR